MIIDSNDAKFAVIFTSALNKLNEEYISTALEMEELAKSIPGFVGMESVRNNLNGISVSYWKSLEDIHQWKTNARHELAKNQGKKNWYKCYRTRITEIIKDY